MSDLPKDRYGVLITVLDMIREEIEKQKRKNKKYESCPVCEEISRKIRMAMLEQNEYIVEAYRLQLGL